MNTADRVVGLSGMPSARRLEARAIYVADLGHR